MSFEERIMRIEQIKIVNSTHIISPTGRLKAYMKAKDSVKMPITTSYVWELDLK